MKNTFLLFSNRILITLIFTSLLIGGMAAQNSAAICAEGDCSPAVFSIQLEEPLQPATAGTYSATRTQRLKHVYQSFQKIKMTYAQSPEWKSKRADSQLGGKSCLRHYQLESQLAYEYLHNPDFKKFIDSTDPQANNFLQNGFESSRKGLNLSKRMNDNCKDEVNELEKKSGPSLNNLPTAYQKLGQELGYFDEQGNLLKPLDPAPDPNQDLASLSKKQQVAALTQQVNQLPVGPTMQNKIGGIKNALGAAQPKLGALNGALGTLGSALGNFLPGPAALLGKVGGLNKLLGGLKNFLPKISVPNLLSKIGNLFKRGKDLGDKAKDLADQSKKLKDQFDNLGKKSKDLQDKLKKSTDAAGALQNKLDDLAKKKSELQALLEDKPKKILDELRRKVADVVKDAGKMKDDVAKEDKLKDKILKELEDLTKSKDDVENKLKDLQEKMKELSGQKDELEKETKIAQEEVEEIKKLEDQIEKLKQEVEELKSEEDLKGEIADCESELEKWLAEITGLDATQEKVKKKMGGLLELPGKLLGKLSELKLFQNKLKQPKNGIPLVGNMANKVDGLLNKTTAIGSIVETLTGKKSKLQEKIEGLDQKVGNVKSLYESKTKNIDQLKKELVGLITEKTGIKGKLNQTIEDADGLTTTVKDFIERYNLFDKKTDCKEQKELEEKIEEVKKEQEETAPEVEKLEEELKKAEEDEKALEEKTQEVEKEIEEQSQKAEELKLEEEAIKEEYGTDLKLEPVTVEEWSESFEVERPYWEAVFHPDDEVVEGQKGRYFEVKLKDAEKNVKLLFGPGQYCMSKSDFRKKYGSTIGSFVTEALHAMKKADQQKVKLFIQGSADITGHKTFSGKLDQQFLYSNINVLPQKADPEKFSNTPTGKSIPERSFRNEHLPDLRGQYLKDMIKVYSKKFDPVILEGVVKDFVDEEERNAVIYLFIPEELVKD